MLTFSKVQIQRDNFNFFLNMEFNKMGIYGVIGPNGSGKTTFIEASCGILKPVAGDVRYFNDSIHKIPLRLRCDIFSVTFANELPPLGLNVADFLNFSKKFTPDYFRKKFPEFTDLLYCDISHLSQGQWISVQIIQNIMADTPIIMLDEAILFLDPKYRKLITHHLIRIKEERMIFMVSHDLDYLARYSDRIISFKSGRQFDPIKEKLKDININALFEI